MKRFAKPDIRLFGAIALFWLIFWIFYPYRELIDDSRYQSIMQHKFLFIDTVMRPIHSWLLYIAGEAGASMPAAAFMGLLVHFATGAIANWKLIPAMPEPMRIPARLGLLAFLLHPVSLQTVVHVAQGSEILGSFFSVILLTFVMRFIPDTRQTGRGAPKRHTPVKRDFVWMAVVAVLALLSKENYFPPLLLLIAAVAWTHRSRAGRNVLLVLIPVLVVGVLSNNFSRETIQNQTNYERSRVYRKAVTEGKMVSPQDSIMLPLRDRSENLLLQTSLIPLITRVVVLPFGLVKDYGYFPYGKDTYQGLGRFWGGLGLGTLLLALLIFFRKKASPQVWALILSPFAYYAVYFVFAVYDPLFLYRLYGLVFFFFVIALPALTLVGDSAARRDRWISGICAVTALAAITGGVVRAYEMRDIVAETTLELERRPENHRLYVARLHALVKAKRFPIDCQALMEPALVFAPSAALVYVDWAWCHSLQRQLPEARARALQALEYECVPENINVALGYLVTPEGVVFDQKKIHPSNIPVMFGNKSK